ncbi:MAG TPA: glucose 1-dehydrogenase [Novosphingobium sp.]|nr:glucose 1-dehydrogenase [Novosphingobium sp.]
MVLERLKLDGKVALVTGGGRGVGKGIASVLAEAGAAVVLTARTPDQIRDTAARIEAAGGRAIDVVADATSRADNERAVRTAIETFGRLDILINNAGGGGAKPFFELTEDDLNRDFQLNAVSAFTLTQLAAPHMIKAGGGSVVNISSRAAAFVGSGRLPYGVAKAALEQLTRLLAHELAPTIRVNAIALGTVMTPALQGYFDSGIDGAKEDLMQVIPLRRIGNVEDIGLAALYFCAADCYATGSILHVDGGIPTAPGNMRPEKGA